jgi:hypothetical protein
VLARAANLLIGRDGEEVAKSAAIKQLDAKNAT